MCDFFPIIKSINNKMQNVNRNFFAIDFATTNLLKDKNDKNESEFWKGHVAGTILCLLNLGLIDYETYKMASYELLHKAGDFLDGNRQN